ncbi:hypothetical protein [Nocardia terpenica]|uniref:Uncharacterized protein n=1 Tax=Nocardia terpenica TaxID=455432 RepID=A0A6G9Z0D7_9NOCA|nr:hypothetical protein [Nocardia terpenica]QIS18831.1 hypothetical protein F6W96_11510 [Nocardia terpenica]
MSSLESPEGRRALDGDTAPGVFYHRTSDALNLELVEMSRGAPAFAHYLNLPATEL